MKILCKEKIKVLAEINGWPLAQAEGYVDGETFRRRGKTPSTYAQIGIDEYCRGFRAGYYERQNVERQNVERQNVERQNLASIASFPRLPMARPSFQRFRDSVELVDATIGPAHSG